MGDYWVHRKSPILGMTNPPILVHTVFRQMNHTPEDKHMSPNQKPRQIVYEIQVQGELDRSWELYFSGLSITTSRSAGYPITALTGPVTDQPALRGLLCKLWDLNLTLISVRQLEAGYP